jgi:hypothetical protein
MAGINEKNYKYLAESIKSAIEQAKWSENLSWFLWIDFCELIDLCTFYELFYAINDKTAINANKWKKRQQ